MDEVPSVTGRPSHEQSWVARALGALPWRRPSVVERSLIIIGPPCSHSGGESVGHMEVDQELLGPNAELPDWSLGLIEQLDGISERSSEPEKLGENAIFAQLFALVTAILEEVLKKGARPGDSFGSATVGFVARALRARAPEIRMKAAQAAARPRVASKAVQAQFVNTLITWFTEPPAFNQDGTFTRTPWAQAAGDVFRCIGKEAAGILLTAVESPVEVIRAAGERSAAEVEALVPMVQMRAIQVLGDIRANTAVESLLRLLHSCRHCMLVRETAIALAKIGPCPELRSREQELARAIACSR